MADPDSISGRIEGIRRRIEAAARACGRDPASIALTAVSKRQPAERIRAALDAGQAVFGENRVQEAAGRWADLGRAGLELRLIGPLQTNKAVEAVGLFDVIETLDRPKLARALAEAGAKAGVRPRVLVQVNTGEESQKSGVIPGEADAFVAAVRRDRDLGVEGLMCIPPHGADPVPHFALLAAMAERNGLATLSMGMSDDFETAIGLGATHVRIGSALFGGRSGA